MQHPLAQGNPLLRFRDYMDGSRLEACVVSDPAHIAYLAGVQLPYGCSSCLLISRTDAVLLSPSSAGVSATGEVQVLPYEDRTFVREVEPMRSAQQAFAGILARWRGLRRVGLEPACLPAALMDTLRQVLGAPEAVDVGPGLRRQRMVKGDAEVEAIARVAATCDRIFAAVEEGARAGCTELDVYLAALRVVAEKSAGPAVLDGDFVSGPRTAEIGGPPTPRVLRPGDLLIVDVYPRVGGYWADCTRSYVVGEPSTEQAELHALLVEAMEAGERLLEPGRPAAEVYEAVRRVLERAGSRASFPHHAGHGVGVTPSEDPRLVPGSSERLQAGMVVTLEPGLYGPAVGGMRLEDNFLVTDDGATCLSRYPRRLVTLPCD